MADVLQQFSPWHQESIPEVFDNFIYEQGITNQMVLEQMQALDAKLTRFELNNFMYEQDKINQMILEQMHALNEKLARFVDTRSKSNDTGKFPSQLVDSSTEEERINTLRSSTQYSEPPMPEEPDMAVLSPTNVRSVEKATQTGPVIPEDGLSSPVDGPLSGQTSQPTTQDGLSQTLDGPSTLQPMQPAISATRSHPARALDGPSSTLDRPPAVQKDRDIDLNTDSIPRVSEQSPQGATKEDFGPATTCDLQHVIEKQYNPLRYYFGSLSSAQDELSSVATGVTLSDPKCFAYSPTSDEENTEHQTGLLPTKVETDMSPPRIAWYQSAET